MDIIPSTAPKRLTNDTNFKNYLLIVDSYSKIPKLYGMENITTAEVLDKLDMFQSRFGKIDQFGWWDLEIFSADAGTQFTSTEFKEECQTRGFRLTLAAPEHQEMNGQVEVTWRTLRTIVHALMVHARVPEICSFCINVYDRLYFSGPTNKRPYKLGWRSNDTIQTVKRYETFSVTFTCFILSVCCT